MNVEFFALAVTAALNPKLLAIDLLLMENRRPRMMFLCVLLGGMTVGLAIGLLDVLVFHVDAISSQKTVSAGVDLGLGLFLLAVGALVATGRLHGRRKAPVPARDGHPEKPEKEKKDGWARLLAEPRLGLAVPKANGTAVVRNRIKRQLREIWRARLGGDEISTANDYVLVVRPGLPEAAEARGHDWLAERVDEVLEKVAA